MVRILVGSRRPWLSDALATWSYDTNVFDQPLSVETLVNAAVSVVLPWSTWPIVPTLQCGLVRSNFSLAIGLSVPSCYPGGRWDLRRTSPGPPARPPAELARSGRTAWCI